MDLNQIPEMIGKPIGTLGAAALGAMFSWRKIDGGTTEKLVMVVAGFCGAIYGTDLVGLLLEMHGTVENAVAFFLGLYAMSLIDQLYSQIKSGAVFEAIRGRFGA